MNYTINETTTGSDALYSNILIVEDDEITSHVISYSLKRNYYHVYCEKTGDAAFKTFMKLRFDVCLIDVNLGDSQTGISLTTKIRSKNPVIPIILMSSDNNVDTKLAGFEVGADDYITKPVNPKELMGRIKLLNKRLESRKDVSPTTFRLGEMQFDYTNLTLKYDWIDFRLSELEGTLLRYLCLNPNRLIRREELLLKLWGKTDLFVNRSMDVYISRLRKYLKSQQHFSIETVRGVGVKFIADSSVFSQEL